MMVPAMYMLTMIRQASRAIFSETNLKTFITLTTRITPRTSEKIQVLSRSHQRTTMGMLAATPRTSKILILNFILPPSFQMITLSMGLILRKYSPSIASTDTEKTMVTVLPTSKMIPATPGSQRLSTAMASTHPEMKKIILYPYLIPQPLNEFHRPSWVARVRMAVARQMRMSPEYSKQVVLQAMLQFRKKEKVPTVAMDSEIMSKQLEFESMEGQLQDRPMEQGVEAGEAGQVVALREGEKRPYCVPTETVTAYVFPVMVMILGVAREYCCAVCPYWQSLALHWMKFQVSRKSGLGVDCAQSEERWSLMLREMASCAWSACKMRLFIMNSNNFILGWEWLHILQGKGEGGYRGWPVSWVLTLCLNNRHRLLDLALLFPYESRCLPKNLAKMLLDM